MLSLVATHYCTKVIFAEVCTLWVLYSYLFINDNGPIVQTSTKDDFSCNALLSNYALLNLGEWRHLVVKH